MEQWGKTAISCTDRKRPGSLPELRLTASDQAATASTGMRRSDHVVPSTRRQRVHISVRQSIRYHCCGAEQALQPVKAPTQRLLYVGFRTEQTSRTRQKVVLLRELQRAIIYTTKMSEQVTKGHLRDAVHMYLVN
jgi:hypothetical protein